MYYFNALLRFDIKKGNLYRYPTNSKGKNMDSNSKEIKIRAVLDASTFDKGVNEIQEKLRKITQQQTQGVGTQKALGKDTIMGKYAASAFGDFSKESQRQLEQMYQVQRREAVNQQVTMRGKQQELEKLAKSDGEMTKQQKERVDLLKKEIDLLKEKHRQTLNTAAETRKVLSSMAGPSGPAGPGVEGPWTDRSGNYRQFREMGFGKGTSGALSRFGGPIGVGAGLAAAAITTGKIGMSVWDEIAERQRNISIAQGSAMIGATDPLKRMIQGKGIENTIFAREREKGLGIMREEMESRRARDLGKGVLDILTPSWEKLAAAAAGAAAGAGFMGIGAIPGAIGGYLAPGLINKAMDKGFRGAVFNTEEYRSQLTEGAIKKAKQIEEAEKARNWRKTMGIEFFQQRRGTFEQAQQQFGTDNAFQQGSFLRQMVQAGMPMQEAMDVASGMQGAAGVTMGEKDVGDIKQAFTAKQAGFTNMGQMVGVMKGLAKGFGEQATEVSMKKFFSEAFKAGVDDSKMVEEMRVFASASMSLAQATGMRVEEAASEIAKASGGDISAQALQTAQTAFQAREQMATSEGAQLQRKLAFAQSGMGKKLLGGATGVEDVIQLSTMSLKDITEDNPEVKSLMKKMGVDDINEFKRIKQEFDIRGELASSRAQVMADELKEATQGMTPDERRAYLTTGEGADKYAAFMQRARIESPTFSKMGFRGALATTEAILGTRLGETGIEAPQVLTQEEIDKIPPGARLPGLKPGIQPTAGERLRMGFERGEDLLTTKLKRTEAMDEEQFMKLYEEPTAPGGASPFEIMNTAADKYDSSAATFERAVDTFRNLIEKGTTPDMLKILQDAAIKAGRDYREQSTIRSPSFGESFIDDLLFQQPNAMAGKGSFKE